MSATLIHPPLTKEHLCKILGISAELPDAAVAAAVELRCAEGNLARARARVKDLKLSVRFHRINFEHLKGGAA